MPWWVVLAAGVAFLLDQASKAIVLRRRGRPDVVLAGGWLRLRVVAPRVRAEKSPRSRVALVLLWLVAALGIVLGVVYGTGFREPALQGGLGLALGGAAGNLADHLRRGAVVDFIDLGWWPVFNVADVGIIAGLLVAVWGLV